MLAQGRSDLAGGEYRPMSPPGTAKRNVDVCFSLRPVARQQQQEQVADAREGFGVGRIAADMLAHRRILAGQRAQHRIPMRVVEEAHVEHQVGDGRHPA